MPKRHIRDEAGNCALIAIILFVLLVTITYCTTQSKNPCDDPSFNQDGTTAQGNRNMLDCGDGWQ